MNLLFCINHNVLGEFGCCLKSITLHGGCTHYDVYVLHSTLEASTYQAIRTDFGKTMTFHFISVQDALFSDFPITDRYPKEIYYRIAAPQFLPEQLERILYLDVDTVVINSLQELYETDSVVYNYTDENGETKQKWETWPTFKEAQKRKAEIENQQHTGTFISPRNQTVREFMHDFVTLYGKQRWGVSMYDSQTGLINNYVNPILGDMEVQSITARVADQYIQTLKKTPAVSTRTRSAQTTYVTDKAIEKIVKLLRCAFNQAVKWEIIGKNPFNNVILPKTKYAKRDIWDANMIRTALDHCTDNKLYVAMNLSFACSLRMGRSLD